MSPGARPARESTAERLFRAALPLPAQTLLLRASLDEEESARRESFLAWMGTTDTPVATLANGPGVARTLAPLVWEGLRAFPEAIPRELGTYLRAAALRSRERTSVYGGILGGLVDALRERTVPFMLLKGAALAWSVYPSPWQRHCHDIDLLIPERDTAGAVEAARTAGFSLPDTGVHPLAATHASGLPLVLHAAPYRAPLHNEDLSGIWERRTRTTVAGRVVETMAPEDALLHVLLHAACGSRRNGLLWVPDALLLVRATPSMDWRSFVERAVAAAAAVPVGILAAYLAREFGAPIPSSTVDTLETAPRSALARQVNLLCVCRTLGWRQAVGHLESLHARAALALRLVLPPPRVLRASGELSPGSPAWTSYPRRAFRPLLRWRP